MSKFCGECATKLVDGACTSCAAKSTSGINIESLEKSLDALESISKGVRPAEAKAGEKNDDDAKESQGKVVKQVKKYGAKGEGDSEEEPKTKRGIESAAKGGFPGPGMPPGAPGGEEEEDPEERRRRELMEEEEGGGEPEFKSAKKKAKKSFAEELVEQEQVAKAIDVSDFLEELVYKIAEGHDALSNEVSKSTRFASYQQNFNVGLAKAMGEFGTLVKNLAIKVDEIGKQPAAIRKSDLSVVEKSFAEGDKTNNEQTLTKSQMASKLLELQQAGDKEIQVNDIIRAESTGTVRPELKAKLGLA
jgi:hypothetical protein